MAYDVPYILGKNHPTSRILLNYRKLSDEKLKQLSSFDPSPGKSLEYKSLKGRRVYRLTLTRTTITTKKMKTSSLTLFY